ALLSGLATGAERVYMHEDGVTLADLQRDLQSLMDGFRHGKRLGLLIRNEDANPFYTTPFMCALFEQEGADLFDVRQAILGHLQQGGDPTAFDRILATRLAALSVDYLATRMAAASVEYLISEAEKGPCGAAAFIGLREGKLTITSFDEVPRLMDLVNQRPREQWWRQLAPIAQLLAAPGPPTA
ncbi:MAG TPA: 6-phosphofructokinase, partial [Vicinamibacteria bacterium]|nr:6-phosphofructokinase [Vicinamibacteria bacterium]